MRQEEQKERKEALVRYIMYNEPIYWIHANLKTELVNIL